MKPTVENLISLREASVTDCEGMAKVSVDTWRTAYKGIIPQVMLEKLSYEKRAEGFRKRFLSAQVYHPFVAMYKDTEVVGFADFGQARDKKWGLNYELCAFYVLPAFQRKGLGVRLFEMGVKAGIRQGMKGMYTSVLEDHSGRKVYEKLGGRLLGQEGIEIGADRYREVFYGWDSLVQALKQAEFARQLRLPFFGGGVR